MKVREVSRFSAVVCALTVVVLFACAAPATARAAWQIEWVERPSVYQYQTNRSLTLDQQGYPHLAYGRHAMMRSWFDGSSWKREVVVEGGDYGFPAVAVSQGNRIRIAFQDQTPDILECALLTPEGWAVEAVDSGEELGAFSSLALDPSGYPHLSYRGEEATSYLYHAWETDRGWQCEIVDSSGTTGGFSTIAIDPQGFPHIVYETYGERKDQSYAWKDASGWHLEALASGGSYIDGGATIVCDEDSYPHICYSFVPHSTLYYQYKDLGGFPLAFDRPERRGRAVHQLPQEAAARPDVRPARTLGMDHRGSGRGPGLLQLLSLHFTGHRQCG